ncbi:hypothetical protein OT109_03875 [Phycisphaeraceae bacterium D3-23]
MATATLPKEQLIDRLRTALGPQLTTFLAQKTPHQVEQEKEIERIEKMIAKEPASSPTLPALEKVVEDIRQELARPGINMPLRRDAALAVLAVCNEHRLPLQFKQDQPAKPAEAAKPAQTKGTRKRVPREEMQAACTEIMKVLPPADTPDHLCMAKSRVAEKCDLDPKTASSALIKLNREGKATSNGIRGAGGGWRKL